MKTAELVNYPARSASPFPVGGRRLLIYVVYDPRGDVEDYIPYALTALREHCDHIVAVVNGALTDRGRAQLEPVADQIIPRENRGFDIWGYKAGLDAIGDRIAEFDEVILANDTWFGPVRPFGPVFERMDRHALHFWGMTDHVRVEPHPFPSDSSYLPYHLQSYWLAVRKDMFLSEDWKGYWRDLPEMTSYSDAVVKHEGIFTERFTDLGFVGEVAFPTITDKIENHAVLYAEQLLEAGCPTLKRRPFFQDPPYLDRVAVIGKWTLDAVQRYGYPIELVYRDLARNVAPRTLYADASMFEAVLDGPNHYDEASPLRTVVVAHIFYPDMTAELLDRADTLPGDYDLVVTVPDEAKARQIRAVIAQRPARGSSEVRVVASNDGRDQSAFLIGCRDVILGGGYDLIVKIHSKRTPQDAFNPSRHFQSQLFDNMLRDRAYTANVVALFQREAGLGLAYPPMVHIGYGTMGHGWWANRPRFAEVARELGVRVPMDEDSPMAPYGSMYFARPEALRILAEHSWAYSQFGGADAYRDGGLAHVLERMPSYAAGERGYHSRTIANRDYVAISHTSMEYQLDQLASTMPEGALHQIDFLRRTGGFSEGGFASFAYAYANLHRPGLEPHLRRLLGRVARVRATLGRLRHPRRWLRIRAR